MRRIVLAAAIISVLSTSAFSEGRGKGSRTSGSDEQTQAKKDKNAEIEKAYKDALKKIPDQKPSDPWTNMR